MRKASSVNKAARADGTFGSRHQRVSFLHSLQPSPAACDDTHDSTFSPKTILLSHSQRGEISQVARFAWTALYWNVVWCWRVTKKGDWARYSAALAVVFLANEALLGAALVLLKHVGNDQSAGRILFLCLHFGNTFLLLATLSLTANWLSNGSRSFTLIGKWRQVSFIGLGLFATMVTGIIGAVAALADTLFPATSLPSSLAQEFSSGTPALLRVRLLHPAVATVAACYVLWVIWTSSTGRNRFSRSAIALITLLFMQFVIGMTNVLFLAPVWIQIAHLFVADALWILLVLASADLLLEVAKEGRKR